MATFLIDAENNITALGTQQADFEGEIFASQKEGGSRCQVAGQPADRGLERYPWTHTSQEVHGSEVGGRPHLESDSKPGRRLRVGGGYDGHRGP